MRNVLDEAPTRDLHGRLAWSRAFVETADLAGRDVLDIGCGGPWELVLMLDPYAANSILRRAPLLDAATTVRVDRDCGCPGFTNVFVRCRKAPLRR